MVDENFGTNIFCPLFPKFINKMSINSRIYSNENVRDNGEVAPVLNYEAWHMGE
jgi:hypothetical protein